MIEIYKCFKEIKDFSFKDQIQRAALSITNNIAEGFERRGDCEFKRFLFIAKGSCGEVRSMIHIALKLSYISETQYQQFFNQCTEISRILSGLIKTLK